MGNREKIMSTAFTQPSLVTTFAVSVGIAHEAIFWE